MPFDVLEYVNHFIHMFTLFRHLYLRMYTQIKGKDRDQGDKPIVIEAVPHAQEVEFSFRILIIPMHFILEGVLAH